MFDWSAHPCQNRLVIFVAVATDQFLVSPKCCHPSADFFAQTGITRGRKGDGEGFDTRRGRGRCIHCRHFKPGIFNSGIFRPGACLRRPRIDGSRKRHGLRDQKIVLLLPVHGEPPAGSDLSKKLAINQAAGFRSPTKSVQERWINSSANPGGDASRKKAVAMTSHDARSLVAPIAVAQQPLVKLAGRQPGQLILKIDRARDLLA